MSDGDYRSLERRVMELERRGVNVPLRPVVGGSAMGGESNLPRVKVLPALPTKGQKAVVWMTATEDAEATGDGNIWEADQAWTRYFPRSYFTDKSGVPVEE